jgi:ribonucleoside-diphosphate reductase alpha chain
MADGLFRLDEDGERRSIEELTWLCVHQYGSFNSPVWFNVGLIPSVRRDGARKCNWHWDSKGSQPARSSPRSYEYPQASACFIQSVDDNMEDIMRLALSEAMLFKFGSGTGTDLSTLRSQQGEAFRRRNPLGPADRSCGFRPDRGRGEVSGGKTRRAAKMQSLKVRPSRHHGVHRVQDARKEKKAWALIEQGYDGSTSTARPTARSCTRTPTSRSA